MSVGHIARLVEEAGISTVVIAAGIFRDRLLAMSLPRLVFTYQPFGRPLGAPDDHQGQRRVILAALDLLQSAGRGGAVMDLA